MENQTGIPDGDTVRGVTCQRQSSGTESMENGISNAMELEVSGPRVGLEVWSCHGVTIITTLVQLMKSCW